MIAGALRKGLGELLGDLQKSVEEVFAQLVDIQESVALRLESLEGVPAHGTPVPQEELASLDALPEPVQLGDCPPGCPWSAPDGSLGTEAQLLGEHFSQLLRSVIYATPVGKIIKYFKVKMFVGNDATEIVENDDCGVVIVSNQIPYL